MKLPINKKLGSTPYLVLMVVLGSIAITTVLAETATYTTGSYTITDNSAPPFTIVDNPGHVGYVGIGTANPLAPFHLVSPGATEQRQTGGAGAFMVLQDTSGPVDSKFVRFGNGGGNMYFQTVNDNYTSASNKMAILNNGNVGIGINIPQAKLDVNGTTHLSGALNCKGCVNNADIANSSINGTQIISGSKIAAGNITATNMNLTGSVRFLNPLGVLICQGCVNNADIANSSINGTQIISGSNIAAGNITATNVIAQGKINATGTIRITSATSGLILTSPDHLHCIMLKVNNTGALVTSPTPC